METELDKQKWAYRLALFHGAFYFVSGLWPLVHIESFLFVTGPKFDIWLVQTVGLMIIATGLVLMMAYRLKELNRSVASLAVLNALFLAGVDIHFAAINRISSVYLLDAAVEIALVMTWLFLFPDKEIRAQVTKRPSADFLKSGVYSRLESSERPPTSIGDVGRSL